MRMKFGRGLIGLAFAASLAACASQPKPTNDADDLLGKMGFGPMYPQKGPALDKAIAEAEKQPLGSQANPVRVGGPPGQRAYLNRLRCSNGAPPTFERAGNLGPGVYGSIVDLYIVECRGGTPAKSEIVMDMYFPDHVENRPVAGFTIVAR